MQEQDILERCAKDLEQARATAIPIPPLAKSLMVDLPFAENEAYQIQHAGIVQRLGSGDKLVGYKMGLTSKAKMEQMGLHTPIFGVLLESMRVPIDTVYSLRGKIHPKAEPEIAFITSKQLKGSVSREEAQQACEFLVPAIEILDSRYRDFKYFSLPDVIADNSSSSDFLLGTPVKLAGWTGDLAEIPVRFEVDGKPFAEAFSNAALGHPLDSLCELVKLLERQLGVALPAGSLVLTGALTNAVELRPHQVITTTFGGLGDLRLSVEAGKN